MKAIIADTSCLIIYDKINKLEILRDTFIELIVTDEVAEEFGDELPAWIAIKRITNKNQYLELAKNLGKGEASSISLALEFDASLLIIDERKGRKVAEEMKIDIIGSLGVLIKAKETGKIESVKEILNLIDKTNFRISNSLKEQVLKKAGEL
jgi:predicted nucleic acid-binding protein